MLFPPTPGRHRLPQKIQKPYRFRPKLQLVSLDTEKLVKMKIQAFSSNLVPLSSSREAGSTIGLSELRTQLSL